MKNKIAVVAVGSATLFIEFGTGVKYPDNHPEAAEHGMIRGGYGYRLGRLEKVGVTQVTPEAMVRLSQKENTPDRFTPMVTRPICVCIRL